MKDVKECVKAMKGSHTHICININLVENDSYNCTYSIKHYFVRFVLYSTITETEYVCTRGKKDYIYFFHFHFDLQSAHYKSQNS